MNFTNVNVWEWEAEKSNQALQNNQLQLIWVKSLHLW